MPTGAISFKLEPLCQLPKPCFEARVPFGDILSFLVCRLFVANIGAPLTGRLPCGSLCGVVWRYGPGEETALAGTRSRRVSLPVSTLFDF